MVKIWYENPRRSEMKIGYQPSMDAAALNKQVGIVGPDAARGVLAFNRFSENLFAIPRPLALAAPALDAAALNADLVYRHIKLVVCGGDQLYTDYFCSWLAFVLQQRKKSKVCIVLTGEHGSGKSILFDYVCEKMIGNKYSYPLDNIGRINSSGDNFNESILVVSNEIQSISKNLYQRIKVYITSDRQQTGGPHDVSVLHHDFSNLVIAANGVLEFGEVIPMECGERRFVFFHVSDHLLALESDARKQYFDQLWAHDPRPFTRYLYELKHGFHPGKVSSAHCARTGTAC